jgi:hypothetical protein
MSRERDLQVLKIVQKCTGWLEQAPRRLQTEGIFRVSGSAKVCCLWSMRAPSRCLVREEQRVGWLAVALAAAQSCSEQALVRL